MTPLKQLPNLQVEKASFRRKPLSYPASSLHQDAFLKEMF